MMTMSAKINAMSTPGKIVTPKWSLSTTTLANVICLVTWRKEETKKRKENFLKELYKMVKTHKRELSENLLKVLYSKPHVSG